jgi:Na+-driven multidrug efflux pump
LNIGPAGIWWGLFIGLTLTALAMFLRLRLLIRRFHAAIKVSYTFEV